MDHFNQFGKLTPGYFCHICGQSCNMYGTGHGDGKCQSDPKLVQKLVVMNCPAGTFVEETTPWFPHYIKPVRSGWYENADSVDNPTGLRWYWDNDTRFWRAGPEEFICSTQDRRWRGLTEKSRRINE